MLYYRNTILIVKLSWDNILIKSPQFKKYRIKFWVGDSRLLLDANFTIQPYFPLIFFTHPTFRQAEVELMIFESWDGNQFISSSSHQTSDYLDPTHLSKLKATQIKWSWIPTSPFPQSLESSLYICVAF